MNVLKRLYDFISSMKTGLVLLTLIGLSMAVTGLGSNSHYLLGFFYRLLLLLFSTNMVLCFFKQVSRYRGSLVSGRTGIRLRLRHTGLLLLHAGVVVIILGGTAKWYLEQNAEVKIAEGSTVDMAEVIPGQPHWSVKLRKFEITYNSDGSPSQYYSHISVFDQNGNKNRPFTISVNYPFKYGKVKVYQESFGYVVRVKCEHNSKTMRKEMNIGEAFAIPGSGKKVKLYRYVPNFDPALGLESKTARPDNPRIIFSVYEGDRLVGVGASPIGKTFRIDHNSSVTFEGLKPFVVLTVKTDPGLPLTSAGGLMMMAGVCMAVLGLPQKKNSEARQEV